MKTYISRSHIGAAYTTYEHCKNIERFTLSFQVFCQKDFIGSGLLVENPKGFFEFKIEQEETYIPLLKFLAVESKIVKQLHNNKLTILIPTKKISWILLLLLLPNAAEVIEKYNINLSYELGW